jgi:hypothetical protein
MPQAISADHFGTRVSNTPAARNTDIGALINSGSAGQPLFEVADLHRVRIYV